MEKRLCVHWQVNGCRGETSPKPETAENLVIILKQIAEMQATWPHGTFGIRTITPAFFYMPR
jgi:hypothetical protein